MQPKVIDDAATPAKYAATVAAICTQGPVHCSGQKRARPTSDPAVPGAIGEKPAPKPVAMRVAARSASVADAAGATDGIGVGVMTSVSP